MTRKLWIPVALSGATILTIAIATTSTNSQLVGTRLETKSLPKNVTLQDTSGRHLSSLFEGMPVDQRYSQLLRHLSERRLPCGAKQNQPSQFSRILRSLGMSFDTVVHAQNCSVCGYQVDYTSYCAPQCGGESYDGPLYPSGGGIGSGHIVCTSGDNCGNGTPSTVNCSDGC